MSGESHDPESVDVGVSEGSARIFNGLSPAASITYILEGNKVEIANSSGKQGPVFLNRREHALRGESFSVFINAIVNASLQRGDPLLVSSLISKLIHPRGFMYFLRDVERAKNSVLISS